MGKKTELARNEFAKHEARIADLTGQQQELLQLYYRVGVDESVMQVEQARIADEKASALRWQELAYTQVAEVLGQLDKALELVRRSAEGYRDADDQVRKMLNRAIFERIEVLTTGDA